MGSRIRGSPTFVAIRYTAHAFTQSTIRRKATAHMGLNPRDIVMSNFEGYPRKLTGNPIEESGLPASAKRIKGLRFYRRSDNDAGACYIGYGDSGNDLAGNVAPVWIVKCTTEGFTPEFLANDDGIDWFRPIESGGTTCLYAPGSDANEQRPCALASTSKHTVFGRRNVETGEFTTVVASNTQLASGIDLQNDKAWSTYPIGDVNDNLKGSCLALAAWDSPDGPQLLGIHTENGFLHYRKGSFSGATWDSPSIAVLVEGQGLRCEEVALAVKAGAVPNRVIIVYRYFYHLYAIAGVWNNKRIEISAPPLLLRDGRRPSVAVADDDDQAVVVFEDPAGGILHTAILPLGLDRKVCMSEPLDGQMPSVAIHGATYELALTRPTAEKHSDLYRSTWKRPPGQSTRDLCWPEPQYYRDGKVSSIALAGDNRGVEVHREDIDGSDGFRYIWDESGVSMIGNLHQTEGKSTWVNYYRLDQNAWTKFRGPTQINTHMFDICVFQNRFFEATQTSPDSGNVRKSRDGIAWTAIKCPSDQSRCYSLFRLGGQEEEQLYGKRGDGSLIVHNGDTDGFVASPVQWKLPNQQARVVEFRGAEPGEQTNDKNDAWHGVYISRDDELWLLSARAGEPQYVPISLPTGAEKFAAVAVDKNNRVFALVECPSPGGPDSIPQVYRLDPSKISQAEQWVPHGSPVQTWLECDWTSTGGNEPTTLAVSDDDLTFYVGTGLGQIWIDVSTNQ